jgi:hypothetical protein
MAIVALSTTEYMVSSITNCFQDVGTYKTVDALAAWSSGIVSACHRRRLDLHLTVEIEPRQGIGWWIYNNNALDT